MKGNNFNSDKITSIALISLSCGLHILLFFPNLSAHVFQTNFVSLAQNTYRLHANKCPILCPTVKLLQAQFLSCCLWFLLTASTPHPQYLFPAFHLPTLPPARSQPHLPPRPPLLPLLPRRQATALTVALLLTRD